MNTYYLGNCLRGYTEGDFESIDEAWRVLGGVFHSAYPSEGGRSCHLYIEEVNKYGYKDATPCKNGTCNIEPLTEEDFGKARKTYFYR